jgi:c(7)-type cytochrome triheme protein
MTRRWQLVLGVLVLAATSLASWLTFAQDGGFPHARHQGLFPSCSACHGSGTELFRVSATTCAGCHDGSVLDPVELRIPEKKPTSVKFDHDFHVEAAEIACADCHQAEGSANRMDVVRPRPELCLTCHGGSAHLAPDTECSTCHLPIAEATSIPAERIAAFPKPENHLEPDFLEEHGPLSMTTPERCATCHARESCERCHANADRVASIQKLGRDPRIATLVEGREGNWPRPPSHDDPNWASEHGRHFSEASCASCHVQESCLACHGADAGNWLEALPKAKAGGPTGAVLRPGKPPGHDALFMRNHGVAAATDNPRCASCHKTEDDCASCHNAPSTPGFHADNYIYRHAPDAYAGDMECANCHSREVFCRECHENSGLSTREPRSSSFHDSQPFWLLAHGQAAREGMEGCASCHQQNDCLRCHSAKSGWRISPHGPGFDAEGLGDRSLVMCAQCHFADPRP